MTDGVTLVWRLATEVFRISFDLIFGFHFGYSLVGFLIEMVGFVSGDLEYACHFGVAFARCLMICSAG